MSSELDVGAAALDSDGADHVRGRVAQLLVGLIRKCHLRRDGDGVAGVDAHRVEVLDRADDDDVVAAVADHLELELVPAQKALLDEDLAYGTLAQRSLEERLKLRPGSRGTSAMAAEREGGPEYDRKAQVDGNIRRVGDDRRFRHLHACQ